jgi:hypothetical protein
MARMTQAEYDALWNVLPGLTNGRYYYINKTADGVAASHTFGPTTFGICLEHDSVTLPSRCTLQIIDSSRARDVGFYANNTITVNVQGPNTQQPVICPVCGLTGTINKGGWVAG